jgi:large subunit ribosomal protein L21
MFAIIKTGGKQYKVTPGAVLHVEKMEGKVGATVTLDNVLASGKEGKLETGEAAGKTAVQAKIVEQLRGDKVLVFKKKRRHTYRRKNGHRQYLTALEIISVGGETAKPVQKKEKAAAPKKEAAEKTEKKAPAKKPAAKKPAAKKSEK